MRRRRLLCALAAVPALLAGCLSGLPTDTGPRAAPTPEGPPGRQTGVSVADLDVESTDDDRLRAVATLRNRGPEPTEATVVVTATVEDESTSRAATVRVPGRGTAEANVEFETTLEAFTGDGSLSARVR